MTQIRAELGFAGLLFGLLTAGCGAEQASPPEQGSQEPSDPGEATPAKSEDWTVNVTVADDSELSLSGSELSAADDTIQWFAEVENVGERTVCYPRAAVWAFDVHGTLVWETGELGVFADTAPYAAPNTDYTLPCLAPGEKGAFYTNELTGSDIDLLSISTLEVSLESSRVAGAAPHPGAPTLRSVEMSLDGDAGWWSVRGTIEPVVDMQQVVVNVYGRNPETGRFDMWETSNSGSSLLIAGENWDFDTGAKEAQPRDDLSVFVSWTEARPALLAVGVRGEVNPVDELAAQRARFLQGRFF